MKKYVSTLMVFVAGWAFSQSILNAKSPEEFRKQREENSKAKADGKSNRITPLSYGYIDEKDIFKSVYVWEVIDLNDKINQPFYYNMENSFSRQNKSLYNVLLDAALSGEIKEVYDDEDFTMKLSPEGIRQRLVYERLDDAALDILESGRQLTPEEVRQYTDISETKTDKVKMIKIFGMWFIDTRDGQMKYRPLGIAAMGPDPTIQGRLGPDGQPLAGADELIDLFWIYYPSAREVLANNMIYNGKNASADISFDDVINARRFSSVIYKSSIGVGDGKIEDYVPRNAEEQIEESNRIREAILAMENEMWNY